MQQEEEYLNQNLTNNFPEVVSIEVPSHNEISFWATFPVAADLFFHMKMRLILTVLSNGENFLSKGIYIFNLSIFV
jgi:hypothetical protein